MKFRTFLPSAVLLPYIREFIIIETHLEFESTTIPDTAVVMTFRYKGKILKVQGGEKETLPATALSGLRRSVRQFQYAADTANLLVIFNEGGINAFSRMPAHELFELNTSSENVFVFSELNELLEQLAEALTDEGRIAIAEAFLQKKLTRNSKPDLLIGSALHTIKHHSGVIRIKDLATSLYISQDAFEKRFRSTVGSTPKQYASIVRMRDLIKKYPTYASLTEASYEAGYFDQSHFIKDFRRFTGQAPKDFLSNFQYW